MANGSSGRSQIGNFSSTIFEHDSLNLMDVFFWNSTGDRMALLFLLRNCALFSSRKVRAFFVGKRCFQRIQINGRDSNGLKNCKAGASPATVGNRSGCPTNRRLQLPVRAIPVEYLLNLCDVFRKQIVEENPLLPVNRALVWHDISVFASHGTQGFASKEQKDGSERFELLLLELFELDDLHLLARKEFEDTRELPSIESPIDISETPRFSRSCATDARLFFPDRIEKIERLAASESLHVPMGEGAIDGISQEDQQFDFRIVSPNPFRGRLMIQVTRCAITCNR